MAAVRKGCAKDINRAAVAEFQTATQIRDGKRKVPDTDVSLSDATQLLLQVFPVHRRNVKDPEYASWEVGNQTLRDEQMAVWCYLTNTETATYLTETAGLHNGGVRLV
jgi:hypothetical protein